MKKTLFLLSMMMLFAMFAIAQTSSPSTSSTPPTDSSSSASQSQSSSQSNPSTSSQSSSDTSQSGANAAGSGLLEGCIIRQQSDYYIQPIAGGEPVKLNSSQDLSAHVGHHVRLQGSPGTGNASSSAASDNSGKASAASSSSPSGSAASKNALFDVTRVDMVSTTCPANPSSGASVPK